MAVHQKLLLAAFLCAFGLSYLGPVVESDFFWHISAGRAIWEDGGLPAGYNTQWLGQVVLYALWKLGGSTAIVSIRVLAYTAVLGGLFLWMRRQGVKYFPALFFLLFPAHLFLSFPSERPQIFSFALFPLTVYLLEGLRTRDGYRLHRLLPLVLIVWGNIHAGFMLGVACVWIYLFAEAAASMRRRAFTRKLMETAVIAVVPVAFFVLIRPSIVSFSSGAALSLIKTSSYMRGVLEYLSPVEAALSLGQYYPSYWLFAVIVLLTLLARFRRMPPAHVLLLVLFTVLSLRSLRFMPFLVLLGPIVSVHVFREEERLERDGFLSAGFAAVLALWLFFAPIDPRAGLSEEFPRKAAAFLNEKSPLGRIFNYQGWAGYLQWALPRGEMFVPVEGVRTDTMNSYDAVLWADATPLMGMPQWSALLDAYGLDTVVMPGMSSISGETFPLIHALVAHRDWRLVYSDGTANVFMKSNPRTRGIIRRYSMDKDNSYLQITSQAGRLLKKEPGNPAFLRSLREADRRLGVSSPLSPQASSNRPPARP